VLFRGSGDSSDDTVLAVILSDSEFVFKTFRAGISIFLGAVLCFDGAAVVLICWSVSLVLRWLSASLSPLESPLTSVFRGCKFIYGCICICLQLYTLSRTGA